MKLVEMQNPLSISELRADKSLVREVQELLIGRYWLLEPEADGLLGPITGAALRKFQELMKIQERETFGPETAQKLLNSSWSDIHRIEFGDNLASRIVVYMIANKYFVATGKGRYNIVYLEGMNIDGSLNNDAPNVFNDVRAVIRIEDGKPDFAGRWQATTEPGRYFTENPMNPNGAARIAFGQHAAWKVGIHGDPGHEALVQEGGPVTVCRDFNRDYMRTGDMKDRGYFGINQHWGYDNPVNDIGRASAGCLVGRSTAEHVAFMEIVKKDERYRADNDYVFVSTIIPADDLMKFDPSSVVPHLPSNPEPAKLDVTWVKYFGAVGGKVAVGFNAATPLRRWKLESRGQEIALLESLTGVGSVPLLARPGEGAPEVPEFEVLAATPIVPGGQITWMDTFAGEGNRPILYGMKGAEPEAVLRFAPATKAEYLGVLRELTSVGGVPLIAPAGKKEPTVGSVSSPYQFRVEKRGSAWYAREGEGAEFLAGRETSYPEQGTRGIYLYDATHRYDPKIYEGKYGIWAWVIYPTAYCESIDGRFACVNTWDRARFTFGFLQYAAHVPQGDFTKYFARILALPEAKRYFPDLTVKNGQIYSWDIPLTFNESTEPLMDYLNRTSTQVEAGEVENVAKFVHWVNNSAAHREVMVQCGIEHFQDAMNTYDGWYGLDGAPDYVCLAIADIHHQGRARVSTVEAALDEGGGWNAIYERVSRIGEWSWAERVTTLRERVAELRNQGKLGRTKWSSARKDFV